jgi:flagellin-like protein
MVRGGLGKRGMSPLIATVLLMAFAVALGGMIMNWSIDHGSKGDCGNIKLQVGRLCGQDGKIILSIRNDPESIQLKRVELNLFQSGIEKTLKIADSALAPGQPFDITISETPEGISLAEIIGVVGEDSNPLTCAEALYKVEPLTPCP